MKTNKTMLIALALTSVALPAIGAEASDMSLVSRDGFGGAPQDAGAASPRDTVACCFPDGGCIDDVELEECGSQGGWPSPTGETACKGDGNTNGVDEACEIMPTISEISDQCGEGSENFCQFIGELPSNGVEDPDGYPTTITNQYSATVDNCYLPLCHHVYFKIECPVEGKGEDRIFEFIEGHIDTNGGMESLYSAMFEKMAQLPVYGTCTFTASVHAPHPGLTEEEAEDNPLINLATTNGEFQIRPPPLWYEESVIRGGNYVGNVHVIWNDEDDQNRTYKFLGQVPYNPLLDHTEDVYVPLFGVKRNSGRLQIDVEEVYDVDVAKSTVEKSAEALIEVWVLGGGPIEDVFDIEVDDEGNYIFRYDSPVLWEDSVRLYEGTLFTGVVDFVQFSINLTVDYAMAVSYHICAEFKSVVEALMLKFQPICVVPDLDQTFTVDLSLDLYTGVATLGAVAEPEFNYLFPHCYAYYGDNGEPDPRVYSRAYLRFNMTVWAYVCAGWGFACWDSPKWELYDPPWCCAIWGEGPVCLVELEDCEEECSDSVPKGQGSAWEPAGPGDNEKGCGQQQPETSPGRSSRGEASCRGPFVSPRIASDANGNAIIVWIHDHNRDSDSPDPDVYYSYFNGIAWSPPKEVARTPDLFESDPRVTFLADGRALLVVTQNQMDQATAEGGGAEPPHLSDVVSRQELVYSIYNLVPVPKWDATTPPSGMPYLKVHDDGILPKADGRAELSAGRREFPFVAWVRDPDQVLGGDSVCIGGSNDGSPCTTSVECPDGTCVQQANCNTDIWVSRWVGAGWSFTEQIGGDDTDGCCAEVDIAFDKLGNAMAVWVRDEDGDGTTGYDRVIEACYYDATINDWGDSYLAVDANGFSDPYGDPYPQGMLWPTVAFDDLGNPAIVFTSRGENGGLMESGDEYGEGAHDFLFVATRSPAVPAGDPFDHIKPIGDWYQTRARWPRMNIADSLAGPLAFVGYRSFKAVGADGYDGEVGIAVKPIIAGFVPGDSWDVATRYTDDDRLDWEIDLDADTSSGLLRLVWARPSSFNPQQDPAFPFASGFDGIQLVEISLDEDCDNNGVLDIFDLTAGTSLDCNRNGILDECDIAEGTSGDCNFNGIPDECEPDCNTNGIPDECDIAAGTSGDCNANGIPDECEMGAPMPPVSHNCCETGHGAGCNDPAIEACVCEGDDYCCIVEWNSYCVEEVELFGCGSCIVFENDCNGNGTLDECDIAGSTSTDCNANAVPDECETIGGGDFDNDGDVDLDDFCAFADCMAGPGILPAPALPDCVAACLDTFDFDSDNDVDLTDFGGLQEVFTQ